MAQRKSGPAAPAKQKLRKNHGPKRHMFKDYKPMIKTIADSGILSKYYDYESFSLSCAARGAKSNIAEMWEEFKYLTLEEKKIYLQEIKIHSINISKKDKPVKKE